MSKIKDFLEQKVNSQFDGELIYLKIEGNDIVGYLCDITTFYSGTVFFKKYNIELPDDNTSHTGHSLGENKYYNKGRMFDVEKKLIAFTHNKEIQSLELELYDEKTKCNVIIDDIQFSISEINNGNSISFDFIESNS